MNFYKSVIEHRGKLLVRGIERNKSFQEKIDFNPTLYVLGNGDWKTLQGQNLKPVNFNSISRAREFKKSYSGAPLFGLDRFQYQYISTLIE